jgi:hypothetical protein
MLAEILANRWRAQEWLLVLGVQFALIGMVHAAGGELPWWGWGFVGLGVCLTVDVAEVLGRRRA